MVELKIEVTVELMGVVDICSVLLAGVVCVPLHSWPRGRVSQVRSGLGCYTLALMA